MSMPRGMLRCMPDHVPLDYEPRYSRRRLFTRPVLAVVLLVVVFGGVQVWPFLVRAREGCGRTRHTDHLRQIGLAVVLYATDYQGAFPDSLETAFLKESLSAEALICPSSSDTKATGATPAQIAANIHAGGHCSYMYVGANLTSASPGDCVLAFESPANHGMDGGYVLYADAHVTFETLSTLVQLVPALEAGQNPPKLATLTQAQATALYTQRWLPQLPAMQSGQWEKKVTSQPMPATYGHP
jgi:hypothetical protein